MHVIECDNVFSKYVRRNFENMLNIEIEGAKK
jgi:hypothetical protein